MNRAEKGLFWDLAAIAWDSETPGTIAMSYEALAKMAGVRVKVLRNFLLKFPKSFVKLDEKSTRTFATLTQPKLAAQWVNYQEISEKRRKAAESRYHANAEQVQHSSSSSSSSTSTKTLNPPVSPLAGGNGLTHDELLKDEKNYGLLSWGHEGAIIIRMGKHRRLFTQTEMNGMAGARLDDVMRRIRSKGFWCEKYIEPPKPEDRPV